MGKISFGNKIIYDDTKSGGGSDYILPQATETTLGGIIAKEKTTESAEVVIDSETGKLYAPATGGGGGNMPVDDGYYYQFQYNELTEQFELVKVDAPSGGEGGLKFKNIDRNLIKTGITEAMING